MIYLFLLFGKDPSDFRRFSLCGTTGAQLFAKSQVLLYISSYSSRLSLKYVIVFVYSSEDRK